MHSKKANLLIKPHMISVRLRLVFILISIVTGVSGVTAILQAKTILTAHFELTRSALPMLQVTQRTERNLNEMFLVLENIDAYLSVTRLEAARSKIKDSTEGVRQNLISLRKYNVSGQTITDLEQRLSVAEASSLGVLDERSALLMVQVEITKSLKMLAALQEKSQPILDDFAFNFTTQLEPLIRVSEDQKKLTNQARLSQIDALFVASLNVSAISYDLDDVITMTRTQAQAHTGDNGPSNRVRLQINSKLNDIINRTSRLPDTTARRALAGYISNLRDVVTNDVGIFARLYAQEELQETYQANRTAHLELIPEISNIATELMLRTMATVDSTSKQLSTAIYHLIWIITLAFLAVLATVALTNHIVIDLQFSRRIRALNNAVRAIAKGNLDHPIEVSGPDEIGDMARALAVFKSNAEDLRRSNVELEKFAYVAAHDLRSPLHAIHDLSIWTLEDETSKLSDQGREYLTLLQQRVFRLKQMLNDLLAYARAGQNEPPIETVNLPELVHELALLADPEGRYCIRYHGFQADILTQRTPLQQIIGNLVNNAVKHHDNPQGNVDVSANLVSNTLVLTIADDGPGIEKRYQEQVFGLFQTLRPRDEVEGSGLGLAIVKKLVTSCKGQIEITSNPAAQRGAEFKITLPLTDAKTIALDRNEAIAA